MIKNALRKQYPVWIFLCSMLMLCSCGNEGNNSFFIVIDSTADTVIEVTAEDLKKDLEKVVKGTVNIVSEEEKLPNRAIVFVLGTARSNTIIAKIKKDDELPFNIKNVKPRGGIWYKGTLDSGQKVIILAGYDAQGMQYAVYDYSRDILGVDPLEYWTGKLPKKIVSNKLFDFENKVIIPPQVPILCYFENDVDELANYRGKLLEYDWESYTEMINSLVRLRYNAIQLFDMLGRPEFFIRPEYKELAPDYKLNVAYLEKMIDYAQSKGMKVAIDFALGYQIHPMSADKATCWAEYKEDWLDAWRYYLEETPLKKTDIFMLRPRHQVWDWEYESSCGENKIEVFNQVYKAFGDLIDEYKPQADKVLVCYSDGMEMWNQGFRPPKDWIVAWSDDGFGDFEHLPATTDGYDFGTYMHAGFWLNHTIHNPYPQKVGSVMKIMFKEYNADSFCLVNGQNFRPFILNLEAYAAVCNNSDAFNGERFYEDWTQHYYGESVANSAVESMELLHKAQEGRIGYVQHLWEIREAISYLSNAPLERPGKPPVPYEFKRVENDLKHLALTRKYIDSALIEATKGLKLSKNDKFYYSYIYLPVLLYSDLMVFESDLHKMSLLKREYENSGDSSFLTEASKILEKAKLNLTQIYQNRIEGDKNVKWEKWYDPAIRRPNNGFPTMEMLEQISSNLDVLSKK